MKEINTYNIYGLTQEVKAQIFGLGRWVKYADYKKQRDKVRAWIKKYCKECGAEPFNTNCSSEHCEIEELKQIIQEVAYVDKKSG